jgi:methionyl-tRNA formyltransferase
VHGGYWALVDRCPEHCGVTVHLVDEGIDTGNVLRQARVEPTPEDNFVTYPLLQLGAGLPLLLDEAAKALDGRLVPRPYPPGASRLRTHPTIWEYARHRLAADVK